MRMTSSMAAAGVGRTDGAMDGKGVGEAVGVTEVVALGDAKLLSVDVAEGVLDADPTSGVEVVEGVLEADGAPGADVGEGVPDMDSLLGEYGVTGRTTTPSTHRPSIGTPVKPPGLLNAGLHESRLKTTAESSGGLTALLSVTVAGS